MLLDPGVPGVEKGRLGEVVRADWAESCEGESVSATFARSEERREDVNVPCETSRKPALPPQDPRAPSPSLDPDRAPSRHLEGSILHSPWAQPMTEGTLRCQRLTRLHHRH